MQAGIELRGAARRPHDRSDRQHDAEQRRTSKRRGRPHEPGKHVFLDKPIANTIADARALTHACRDAGVVLALGYQRRKETHFRWIRRQIDDGVFGRLVNAEANISRDRLGKIDLTSWRYTAEGMPGGVMLQIGIHYSDVLEYLIGPVKAVSGRLAQLVLPGDNPDVASLILEHENGAFSTLNASYASASEYLRDEHLRQGSERLLRSLRRAALPEARNASAPTPVEIEKNDPIVEELEEFAAAVRGDAEPEMNGERVDRFACRAACGNQIGARGTAGGSRRGACQR